MTFHIRVDAKDTLSWLDRSHKQAPFAIATALNRTAEDGMAVIWGNVQAGFTIRTLPRNLVAPQFLPKAYRARKDKLTALIEPRGVGQILAPFEEGRPHVRDRLGRPVAVPSSGFMGLRSSKRTVIPRRLYPGNLGLSVMRDSKGTLYYATGKGAKRRGIKGPPPKKGRYGTYQVTTEKGSMIFQRLGSGTTRLLWTLKDSVRRPANLHFYRGVQETVDARWESNMLGAWDFAMRTADRTSGWRFGK